jgi:uncharacterized membrane protein YphA (DoxX/SURF4 family)
LVEHIALSARLALAVVFLSAATGKARTFREFAIPLQGLGLPRSLTRVATAVLIAYEALVAALLVSGLVPRLTVVLVALLLAGFVAVALFAVASGRRIACNCFGGSSSLLGWRTVARSLLMALALAAYAAAPTFAEPLGGVNVLHTGALTAALLLLAAWGLTGPSLVSLARQRRASQRLARLLLEAADRPLHVELDLAPLVVG